LPRLLQWDKVDNKTSVVIYGAGAIVLVWLSATVVNALNNVPLVRLCSCQHRSLADSRGPDSRVVRARHPPPAAGTNAGCRGCCSRSCPNSWSWSASATPAGSPTGTCCSR
jgi:hypothetical protein